MAGKEGGAGRLLEDAQAKLAARLMKLVEAVEAEAIPADAAARAEEAKRLGVMSRAGAALALMRQRNERARNERLAGTQRRKLERARGAGPAPVAPRAEKTKDTDERRARRIERLRRIADRQLESIERTIEIKCAEGRGARAAQGVPAMGSAQGALGAAGA